LVSLAARLSIEPDKLLGVLKATVVKGPNGRAATDEELAAFSIVANQYGLNPFTRELHAFVGKGGAIVPMVGVDGWARIVNNQPEFDGVEFVEHVDSDGVISAVTCRMWHRKRTHAVEITEYMSECVRPTDPWKSMPRRMLRHKAFMQAARYCFGLTGLFDEDEAHDVIANEPEPAKVEPLPTGRQTMRKVAAEPKASEELLNQLSDAFQDRGWGPQEVKDFCETNKCRWATLTQSQAETLWANLPAVPQGDAAE
jgi:phage recombination protein Bet